MGSIVIDESIDLTTVMSGFIIPKAAVERPDLVPLGIEWPHTLSSTMSEGRQIRFDGETYALIDVELEIAKWSAEGPIEFVVRSDTWTVGYQINFDEGGPKVNPVDVDAEMVLAKGDVPLSEFIQRKVSPSISRRRHCSVLMGT